MIECYECETSGQNCLAHRVPPAGQERHSRCTCPDPLRIMTDSDPQCPLHGYHAVREANGPMPRTCTEAGKFCVDQCTLNGRAPKRDTIVDPDCFRGPKGRERLAKWRAERADDEELPTPIKLTQCRFCGGPGHAYGERCGRVLAGRAYNLTSPSARLGYAIAQLNGLRTLNAEYVDHPGATTTAKFAEGVLKHTCDALDAIHEALADLYTGRL